MPESPAPPPATHGPDASARLDAILSAASEVAIIATDRDGLITTFNRGAERLLGYSAQEMIGQRPQVIHLAEEVSARSKELTEQLGRPVSGFDVFVEYARHGGADVRDWTYVRKDGTQVTVSLAVTSIRDASGAISGFLGVAIDVTARSRLEEELRQAKEGLARRVTERTRALLAANEQLRKEALERRQAEERNRQQAALIDLAHDAIILRDQDGRIRLWNKGAERLYGWPAAEAIGRNIHELLFREIPDELSEALATTLREGEWIGELAKVDRSGKPVVAESRWSRIDGGPGEPATILVIDTDITARKRLESQLLRAQKMEAVGHLAGGVAHDFNNLLGVIAGYTELLMRDLPPASRERARAGEIKKAADRAAGLTRQLLAFSRGRALQPKLVDLNALVVEVDSMLRRLISERVQILTLPKAGLGGVKADPGQIEQVLINLAINARDAMPNGGRLIIETDNVELDEAYARKHPGVVPGRYVMLAVSDTGHGMDPATMARVFEPFFTTKEEGKGSGLGLATAYGIIRQSGGSIDVYSEANQGSTFKVFLPRIDEGEGGPREEVSRAAPQQRGTERILLVEDAEALRVLIRELLESVGYTVLDTSTPENALTMAEATRGPIDLLLTDVIMPRMTGPQLAHRLREMRPSIRVIFMSGYTDQALDQQSLVAAGAPYLQKPFTMAALLDTVRRALDGSTSNQRT